MTQVWDTNIENHINIVLSLLEVSVLRRQYIKFSKDSYFFEYFKNQTHSIYSNITHYIVNSSQVNVHCYIELSDKVLHTDNKCKE